VLEEHRPTMQVVPRGISGQVILVYIQEIPRDPDDAVVFSCPPGPWCQSSRCPHSYVTLAMLHVVLSACCLLVSHLKHLSSQLAGCRIVDGTIQHDIASSCTVLGMACNILQIIAVTTALDFPITSCRASIQWKPHNTRLGPLWPSTANNLNHLPAWRSHTQHSCKFPFMHTLPVRWH
jgi:hypothetical protein